MPAEAIGAAGAAARLPGQRRAPLVDRQHLPAGRKVLERVRAGRRPSPSPPGPCSTSGSAPRVRTAATATPSRGTRVRPAPVRRRRDRRAGRRRDPVTDAGERARIKRFNATVVNYLFLLYFDTRVGTGDTGPYPLPDGRTLLVRDFYQLAESDFSWSAVARDVPYNNLTAALVLDDVKLRVNDWGTSVTDPEDYLDRLVGFGLFTTDTPDRSLRPVPLDELDAHRGRRARRAGRPLPQRGRHDEGREDRVRGLRVLLVPAPVRRGGGRRRRARLDRPARHASARSTTPSRRSRAPTPRPTTRRTTTHPSPDPNGRTAPRATGPSRCGASRGTSTSPTPTAPSAATCASGCSQRATRLVLGLPGRRGPAPRGRARPRRAPSHRRGRSRCAPRVCGPSWSARRPNDHWSVNLEAFGVALDDPAEAYRGERGDRMALGLDLEWEATGDVFPYPGMTRYEQACAVHGEVLVGDERIAFDGWGERDHSWGVRDWWSIPWCWTSGRLGDGTAFHAATTLLEGVDWHPGFVVAPGDDRGGRRSTASPSPPRPATSGSRSWRACACTTSTSPSLPVGHAPVLLEATDGRVSRFPRSLCRFDAADGRSGYGWTEWNQLPPCAVVARGAVSARGCRGSPASPPRSPG